MKIHKKIKQLERWLNKIDYELRLDFSTGILYGQIYSNKGGCTGWYIFSNSEPRVQPETSFQHSCVFYLEEVQFYKIGDACVGIRAKNNKKIFLQFYKR